MYQTLSVNPGDGRRGEGHQYGAQDFWLACFYIERTNFCSKQGSDSERAVCCVSPQKSE